MSADVRVLPSPHVAVTTSWDDGHVLDLRLAERLQAHGVAGTFYVAPRCVELDARARLDAAQLNELATGFEIGGHTLTHRRLPQLARTDARREIVDGKADLEDTIGQTVRAFCYPGGEYERDHVELVRTAGFTLARTVQRWRTDLGDDHFQVPTTVHAYRHLRDPLVIARHFGWQPRRVLERFRNWDDLAIDLFDATLERGGVFHLWGHSWEIDAHGGWARLERVLRHIGGRSEVAYVTNGELLETPAAQRDARPSRPVIQVAPYYPPHIGGMENVAGSLAAGLATTGPVEVLTSTTGGPARPSTQRHGHLTVRRLTTIEAAHLPFTPTLLGHLLRAPRDAVVHVHVAQAYVPDMVRLAAFLRRRPYIAHFHLDVEPSGRFGSLFRLYKRHFLGGVLRCAAAVVVLSDDQATFVRARYRVGPDRIAVVPNGVGAEFFAPPRTEGVSGRPLRLLYVGRLSPQKNVARLLRAMAEVTSNVQLLIVGDGEERQMLTDLAADLHLANVAFAGPAFGDELVAHYHRADAFVLASDKEGMPLVVLEAMAAGLPIVATDVPGLSDTVGVDGLLAEPEPKALAEAIDHLAGDGALQVQLSLRSRARAEERAWPALVADVRDLYRKRLP